VVVGTVLDPSMSGEVRVTVVATGLGRAAQATQPVLKPRAVAPAPAPQPAAPPQPEVQQAPMIQVVKATGTDGGHPDWKRLERPTYERRQRDEGPDLSDQEYLDIPAFLRRQAD
jgi:cell division protein FtsZ